VSTRAAADSAARAGVDVIALDAYADLDQHPSVRALSLARDFGTPFSPDAVVAAARALPSDAVVYLSSFENHPQAVDALASGRALWGNGPEVLQRVRDPTTLAAGLSQRGVRVPQILAKESHHSTPTTDIQRWMLKPRMSGGGHGVTVWKPDEKILRSHFLQEYVEGVPGSVVFVAAGGRGVALGVSRQLVGESAFGVSGFRYCGNILGTPLGEQLKSQAIALVDAATAAFPLVGVGAIDFIASDSGLLPIEVNPRWSASMELVERAHGISMFGIHVDACSRAALPTFDLKQFPDSVSTHGKAIVYATHDVVVGNTREWLEDSSVRDVPHAGEPIAAGQPICTVFAVGSDAATCHEMLVERANRIYAELYSSPSNPCSHL
jgi:predicted ATP-grasp superfamily ATP-dependent carboligase